jgi:benzoylsuccinyl-CoA thiolase BbsB subunit
MANAVVIGAGMHPCGRYPEKSFIDLAYVAVTQALDDAGVSWADVGALYASHTRQGISAGELLGQELGLSGIPIFNVENACASGTTAIHLAAQSIAAGAHDVAVVVGFERMERGVIGGIGEPHSYATRMGLNVMPAMYALSAQKHMSRYGTTARQLALVAVKNHRNGALNPYAQFRNELTVDEVLQSRPVCDPLTLYQCCPTSDGAAAVVLVDERLARRFGSRTPVRVAGSAVRTSRHGVPGSEVSTRTARAAYEAAGIGPEDVGLCECHDAFTIGEIMHYEELGFCPEGAGGHFIEEGHAWLDGRLPVNPSGGLEARGHPLGMTGVAQVCEVVWQMRGEAGQRQVRHQPKVAVTHTQGYGGVCAVGVFNC